MAIFGVELEDNKESRGFIKSTVKRLKNTTNLAKNPFNGFVLGLEKEKRYYAFVFLDALYPKIPISILFFIYMGILIFTQFQITTWLVIPTPLLILNFFHSKTFMYLMFKMGLRKAKYKGSINLMTDGDLLRRLAEIVPERP